MCDVSIVLPILNEEENLSKLFAEIHDAMKKVTGNYEIIAVDDGSIDNSYAIIEKHAKENQHIKCIRFRKRFGQTAALSAGLKYVSGKMVVTMDADLQSDPVDIPVMVEELQSGYDLVQGWRKKRQDALLHRCLPSRVANFLVRKITGTCIHDLGCTLRVMKAEIVSEILLYGDMHRFFAVLAEWRGANIQEVEVHHRPRVHGQTKYGLSRTISVSLDMIALALVMKYLKSPMRLFGGIGALLCIAGIASFALTIAQKIYEAVDITGNPTFLFSVFFMLVGIQFILMGFLGELCARIYHSTKRGDTYSIQSTVNL